MQETNLPAWEDDDENWVMLPDDDDDADQEGWNTEDNEDQTGWIDLNDAAPQEEFRVMEDDHRLTTDELKRRLHRRLREALYHLYPHGNDHRRHFSIGDVHGREGESLRVELEGDKRGLWHDFATGEGGDIFDLWGAAHGWKSRTDFPEIVSSIHDWLGTPIRPVYSAPRFKPSEDLGAPTGKWEYEDINGNLIACIYRYDTPRGKEFRPWDVIARKHKAPDPRPLYNQPGIMRAESVIIVEGEKCADALIKAGHCATTAMNGANAPVDKTDWSPLRGKHVMVWPDHDIPGREYGDKVIKKLRTLSLASLSIMVIPEDKPEKWDAADALEEENFNLLDFLKTCHHLVTAPSYALPAYTVGQLLDDKRPMPLDLVAPRVLTPGGLLVFGGAPKVGKTDFLLTWLAHMAAGLPFLGLTPPHPLKIFCLQTEIMYDYLRERLQRLPFDPHFLPLVRKNLVLTPQLHMLLDEEGVQKVYETLPTFFDLPDLDVLMIDPLRNVFDAQGRESAENDNMGMLAFLRDRIEKLRSMVNPSAGVILSHHTKKVTKKMVEEDPFQALSGAGSLRSFYSTGILLFRPDEQQTVRQMMFELRNGAEIPNKWVDKIEGQWREMAVCPQRTVRKDFGKKCDGERQRCQDVIVQLILDEARKGNLYTPTQFAQAFINASGLGGRDTIYRHIHDLCTLGCIKFTKQVKKFETSKYGAMCVENMEMPTEETTIDPETGELVKTMRRILPTHFKDAENGKVYPVENPERWVYGERLEEE